MLGPSMIVSRQSIGRTADDLVDRWLHPDQRREVVDTIWATISVNGHHGAYLLASIMDNINMDETDRYGLTAMLGSVITD